MAHMRTQLEVAGLPYYRLAATDARTLSATERDRWYSQELNRRRYHKLLAPGEIACYISHIRSWEHLLASDWSHAVILEDDVELAPHFRSVVDRIAALPESWDVIKLGAGSPKPVIRRVPLPTGESLCAYSKVPNCTHAQAISRQGARKLLGFARPFGRPVDLDLQHPWEADLTIYGLEPFSAHASATIQSEIWKITARDARSRDRFRFLANGAEFTWNRLRFNARRYGLGATMRSLLPGGGSRP
jgi:glycosyl transferase family 25